MQFVAPDTCLEDYKVRRSAFIKQVNGEMTRCGCLMCLGEGDNSPHWRRQMKERNDKLRAWMDANSPYSPAEKLQNLMRALFEEDVT